MSMMLLLATTMIQNYIYRGDNNKGDNDNKKCVRCIRCFPWDHEECALCTSFTRSTCRKQRKLIYYDRKYFFVIFHLNKHNITSFFLSKQLCIRRSKNKDS